MKILTALVLGCLLAGHALAVDSASRITPAIQAALDAQKRLIAQWAADPSVIDAVKAQNAKGPIPGMTNGKWKSLKADDPAVTAFQKNRAGVFLAKKQAASKGLVLEAFLNAAQGEKAAFTAKPSSYLHAKTAKFDDPMIGRPWQGKPEFDKSSYSHSIQLSTPVLDRGKAIGVLVVGFSMKDLKALNGPQ